MNPLSKHYSKFKVSEKLLLTGHSHQAWPDCAFEAQGQAWLDAAKYVDDKWDLAFEKADRVRQGFAQLLDDDQGYYALGVNTHELVVRFISSLSLKERPRLITSDSEFHSLRRQLSRLSEEGIETICVPSLPIDTFGERVAAEVNKKTAAVLISSTFFNSGLMIHDSLPEVMQACEVVGADLLVDVYHSLNVIPFSVRDLGLGDAFIVGGGYKYCQLGEGNCFLRFPKNSKLRPVITGWMADFSSLEFANQKSLTEYGDGPQRFAGSTYDPASHYRASKVFDFFRDEGLTPEVLREISQKQMGILCSSFDGLKLNPNVINRDVKKTIERVGGFLALHSLKAHDICMALKAKGVFTDSRGDVLRFGPAPYLSDEQLRMAMKILGEIF